MGSGRRVRGWLELVLDSVINLMKIGLGCVGGEVVLNSIDMLICNQGKKAWTENRSLPLGLFHFHSLVLNSTK